MLMLLYVGATGAHTLRGCTFCPSVWLTVFRLVCDRLQCATAGSRCWPARAASLAPRACPSSCESLFCFRFSLRACALPVLSFRVRSVMRLHLDAACPCVAPFAMVFRSALCKFNAAAWLTDFRCLMPRSTSLAAFFLNATQALFYEASVEVVFPIGTVPPLWSRVGCSHAWLPRSYSSRRVRGVRAVPASQCLVRWLRRQPLPCAAVLQPLADCALGSVSLRVQTRCRRTR